MLHPSKAAIYVAKVAAIALVYFAAARAGLLLSAVDQRVTLVWPPAGIALAVVLLYGPRFLPGIALGAFLANISVHAPGRLGFALVTAAGNPLGAVMGALLLRRFDFRRSLARVRDVFALLLGSGMGAFVSAIIGSAALAMLSRT